jgi:polyhydroxybutyrate depolymerase
MCIRDRIGDTANIIVLIPQAVSDPFAGTAWNSGAGVSGYYPNSSVNDIGFLNALIDSTLANYSVDPQRVYLCGFSMGGFMTYRMALQSNSRFAAFASMSGTVGTAITTYNPGRHVPIAHWHGTADGTVAFTGNQYGLDADSVVSLWAHLNQCNPIPDTTHFPNNNPGDSITVDMYRFHGMIPEDEVRFYIMNGADHTVLFQPSNDVTEPYEIWMFFRNYRWLQAGIADVSTTECTIQFFPNPAVDYLTLLSNGKGTLEILDITGKLMQRSNITESSQIVDIRGLSAGMYVMKFTSGNSSSVQKLIVR